MADVDAFVENFLKHEYDPVKAREYYLRTRKLKGRKAGSPLVDSRSKIGYNGKPLKKVGQRIEEDETPETSPSGAKLVDYDGKGLGKATYADGSVYDGASGWKRGGSAAVNSARAANNAQRAKSGLPAIDAPKKVFRRRIGAAEQKLIRAKSLAKKVKDPAKRAALLKRLSVTERRLKAAKTKYAIPTARKGLRE